jgi:hypothetical protein
LIEREGVPFGNVQGVSQRCGCGFVGCCA